MSDSTGHGEVTPPEGTGAWKRGPRERRLCLIVDVEHYSGRSHAAQMQVQDGVAHALDHACRQAGVRWTACERQDRGDGQLLLLPSGVDEGKAVPGLVLGLRDMLPVLNARAARDHCVRLRVAMAQGAVQRAPLGFVAWSVELASRLLDCGELRSALAGAPSSDMALIVPPDLYADCFAPGAGGLSAAAFRKVRVDIPQKRFASDAWISVLPRGRTAPLGFPVLPPDGPLVRPRRRTGRLLGTAAAAVGAGTLLMLRDAPEAEDDGTTPQGTAAHHQATQAQAEAERRTIGHGQQSSAEAEDVQPLAEHVAHAGHHDEAAHVWPSEEPFMAYDSEHDQTWDDGRLGQGDVIQDMDDIGYTSMSDYIDEEHGLEPDPSPGPHDDW
ncbi:hypothetical protein [Streptomyces sp. NPDC002889]|uniref:hypothetical protein n=1 Tax=Streptomyces sp. NPDC002889 TaxID=3364669 RepID=UPI0036AEEDAC